MVEHRKPETLCKRNKFWALSFHFVGWTRSTTELKPSSHQTTTRWPRGIPWLMVSRSTEKSIRIRRGAFALSIKDSKAPSVLNPGWKLNYLIPYQSVLARKTGILETDVKFLKLSASREILLRCHCSRSMCVCVEGPAHFSGNHFPLSVYKCPWGFFKKPQCV